MNSWMESLITMSLLAGVNAIIVLLAKVILRKCPRKLICILWSVVFLRMLLPVGISSRWSLYNAVDRIQSTQLIESKRIEAAEDHKNEVESPVLNIVRPELVIETSAANKTDALVRNLGYIWAGGFVVMLVYLIVSINKIRKITQESIPFSKYVRKVGKDQHSFLFGSTVYLADGMTQNEEDFVLKHELTHRARGDVYWKLAGYVLLCFHWFNPVLWAAYIVFCHDLEVACDERVIAKMSDSERADYAQVLLNNSRKKKNAGNFSVAFAGKLVKQRIKHILSYRKMSKAGVFLLTGILVVLSGCLMTNPVKDENNRETEKRVVFGGETVKMLLTDNSVPVNELKLGMDEKEIISVLGEPDERGEQDGVLSLMYEGKNDLNTNNDTCRVRLYFSGNTGEWRLYSVGVGLYSSMQTLEEYIDRLYGVNEHKYLMYPQNGQFGDQIAPNYIGYQYDEGFGNGINGQRAFLISIVAMDKILEQEDYGIFVQFTAMCN